MNLYISDLHFGHNNVIKHDQRPFTDADEMDKVIIDLWNGRVQPDDTVYIIGDLCYKSQHSADWYLSQLRGHKILILGNHDSHIPDDQKAMQHLEGVHKMLTIKDGENSICLCHYPLADWDGAYHGTWHIYGHIHNRINDISEFMMAGGQALNAGCMINNYIPVSFNELVRNNEEFRKGIEETENSIFETILNTPKPDDTELKKECAEIERRMLAEIKRKQIED